LRSQLVGETAPKRETVINRKGKEQKFEGNYESPTGKKKCNKNVNPIIWQRPRIRKTEKDKERRTYIPTSCQFASCSIPCLLVFLFSTIQDSTHNPRQILPRLDVSVNESNCFSTSISRL